MFYFINKNYIFFTINCFTYLNPVKRFTPIISSCYLTLANKYINAKLQKVTKQAIFEILFVDFVKNKWYFRKDSKHSSQIKLKTMNDVTELSELVEKQEVSENCLQLSMQYDEEYSQSENESIDQEHDECIRIETVPHKENYYQHSFDIKRHHYKRIVGSKGEILQRLCSETKTTIKVSKKKKHVVIIGSVQKRIIHAKRQINNLIEKSKKKINFTHFISIPTNTGDIRENFIKFKENVMKNCDTETTGFHENMFQKPEKLHLTICMLCLLEELDQQKAIESLSKCKEEIIEPILNQNGPISMELRGLTCMEDNPTKAKILYVKVYEDSGLFQKMSNAIYDYFIEQGLSIRQYNEVKLHMTVINTVYAQRKKGVKARKNFDATNILKDHKDTCFGKINLSTFHLSNLAVKTPDGYFEAMSKIQF